MSDVKPWPKVTGRPEDAPPPIKRPCEYGLDLAVMNMETQMGTIEAYNGVLRAAAALRAQIEAGKAKPQNPLYAVSVDGSRPTDTTATKA